jgi:epsilon-lactone hydrolase
MRIIVEPNKGRLHGTTARVPFDAIMERVASPGHLVSHIAARAGVQAFVPETGSRLSTRFSLPRKIFGRATSIERGFSKIAVTGDSTGGTLALGLIAFVSASTTLCEERARGLGCTLAGDGPVPLGLQLDNTRCCRSVLYLATGGRAGALVSGRSRCG